MAFGLNAYGHNSSIAISSDIPSMVFVGKATRVTGTGLTYYAADEPGNYWDRGVLYPAAAGHRDIYCRVSSYCGTSFMITLTMANDNGVFTYAIESLNKPMIFINSTHVDVYATVFGIANSGTIGPNGNTIWHIKVCVSYPVGWRESSLQYLSVYCFDKIPNQAGSGYGMAVYDASGKVTFSSAYKPLKVKDIVQLTATNNPANLEDLLITKSYLTNPVTPMFSINKPAFLNVEWGRYKRFSSYSYRACTLFNPYGQCVQCGTFYAVWNQTFVTGGINVNAANNDLVVNLIGQDIDGRNSSGASQNYYTKYEAIPTYIPVISGADYD